MTGAIPFRQIGDIRPGGIVAIADHASNHVPLEVTLGIETALMHDHIALDIGVEGVADRLARCHGIPAHIATISRLVCDFNRAESDPAVVPQVSDGHVIPGNLDADIRRRVDAYYRPYHSGIERMLAVARPRLILALHSFTPVLKSRAEPRPWEVALLHNTDDRAARIAIRLLREKGMSVGDNEPYSGRDLNTTMNRHAEAACTPYCAIEIRQDQIADESGQARWAALIAEVARQVVLGLEAQ